MKAIIIDDEKKARSVLSTLIKQECKDIKELYQESNLISGVKKIKEIKPDIVFLDIEMPQHSGLEILDFFKGEKIDFNIVFTTAYNQYALKALKMAAIDYLLKPIDEQELKQAVTKVKMVLESKKTNTSLQKIERAFEFMASNRLAIEVPKGVMFISYDDIIYFEADGVYTKLHLQNGKTELICKTLKYFSEQLSNKPIFYRPHRSYLINVNHMSKLEKKDNYFIVLKNKKTIPIARDKKEAFLKMVEQLF